MIATRISTLVRLGILLVFAISACSLFEKSKPATTTTPDDSTLLSFPIATPYASEPASGICSSSAGETITVTINPDSPDPRCTRVREEQQLIVVNKTANTIQGSIGVFKFSLSPEDSYTISHPFIDYLAVGVHQLQISPCCTAELWLEGK